MKKWSNEEIENAKNLLKKGLNYIQIGVILERSSLSVKAKLNRSGFVYREITTGRENRNCIRCGTEFNVICSEEKKFCGSSCAAIIENKYTYRVSKYCNSKCQNDYYYNEYIKKWLLGEENGTVGLVLKTFSRYIKRYILETQNYTCISCNNSEWLGQPIPLEIDHIDGNHENNKRENLQAICPNCHSQTKNYKGKNVGFGRSYRRDRYKDGKSY